LNKENVSLPAVHGLKGKLDGLKIKLFGGFRVRRGQDLIEPREWGGQKTRSLLKLLLTRPGRAFARDEIMEVLWPGVSPKAAERDLRVTVSRLRKALEPDLKRGSDSHYVLRRSPGYSFNPQANCQVDAWEFEKHQNKAETAQEEGRLEEAINEYRAALELLQGEFLAEDPYEDWAMEVRREWQERHLTILSGLSECLALRGLYTEAIEVCTQALALDEYRESLYRQLMLYHYCAGEQALALRTFRRYAKTLKENLGVFPSPEMDLLKERIEARDVPGVDTSRRYPRPRRPLRFPYSLGRTHFVGRDKEYALLLGRLKETLEGSGSAVAVEGEAGVGKTRLVEEFLGYARSRGVHVLSGRCYERELGPPLEPVTDALGPSARMVFDVPDEKLGYEQKAGAEEGAWIYGALVGELIRLSQDAEALVLFVDDVQWADQATLEFLAYAARRIHGEKVLLVLNYRREDVSGLSGWLEALAERRAIATLSLSRLSLEDTKEFVGHMASRGFRGLLPLAYFLYQESEGNPFYAVEYLRWLIESSAVEIDARQRIHALKQELIQANTLPSGVRSLLGARISSFSDETRRLLDLAAIVGRSFDLKLLCETAGCEELEAFDAIEPLISSGLIIETAEETYHFSHDKLRQTLYESIGSPKRRALHLRVAQALESDGGEPAELAHHYLRARAWRPALENLIRAAKKAEESHAWATALESYERALEVVGKLEDSDESRFELLAAREALLERVDRGVERAATVQEMFELANSLGDRTRIAEVHLRHIGVLAALSDSDGATDAYRTAVSIFRELEDREGEARAHREMSYVRWVQRDYAGSLEANFQALRIHREIGDRWGEASDIANIVQVYRTSGDYEQALNWAERGVEVGADLEDEERMLGEGMHRDILAFIHRERGDFETELSLRREQLKMLTEIGNRTWISAAHNDLAIVYLAIGAPEIALEHYRASARISQEMGHTREEGHALMSVGVSLEQTGDHGGATDAYRQAIELLDIAYELSGSPEELSGRAEALTLLANILHRSLEEPIEALQAYEAAVRIYKELDDTYRLRKVLLGMAGLMWRMGELEDSARCYEEALNLARAQSEAAHEAAALASLGVVYRDLGRLREAIRYGQAALRLMRELNDPQTEAYLLSSLAESHRRLKHYPSALSYLRRSLRLRRKIGDEKGEVGVLEDLAKIHEDIGKPEAARFFSEEAASKKQALEEVSSVERRN
jgi:DNA-binding SARP family transcriptional activator